jgi:hypothetical protein
LSKAEYSEKKKNERKVRLEDKKAKRKAEEGEPSNEDAVKKPKRGKCRNVG